MALSWEVGYCCSAPALGFPAPCFQKKRERGLYWRCWGWLLAVPASLLIRALGIVLSLLSFREHNAIDGDSPQSCQTQPVILSQRSAGLWGSLPTRPTPWLGCVHVRGILAACPAPLPTGNSPPCADILLSSWEPSPLPPILPLDSSLLWCGAPA